MNAFKQQCIELRKKDYTLPEIMKITDRGKTSIYFHIKDIPLSKKKKKEISEASAHRARKASADRRGKSDRTFSQFSNWTTDLVLLVSHLIFDGELRRTTCGYSNRSKALITRVENLFEHIYKYEPKRYFNKKTGVLSVRHHNVALASYLQKKSQELLLYIKSAPKSQQREFLRAFFDDEGCMDVRLNQNKRRVRGYQNDREILKLIRTLLTKFNIESKLQGKNEVVITGKGNLKKFQKEINFSKGIRLNPRRANSIWKKPIEKRVLLDMAIKSFKT